MSISYFPHWNFLEISKGHQILLKLHEFMIEYSLFKLSFSHRIFGRIKPVTNLKLDSAKGKCYKTNEDDLIHRKTGVGAFPLSTHVTSVRASSTPMTARFSRLCVVGDGAHDAGDAGSHL
jgi:hypothetical protein